MSTRWPDGSPGRAESSFPVAFRFSQLVLGNTTPGGAGRPHSLCAGAESRDGTAPCIRLGAAVCEAGTEVRMGQCGREGRADHSMENLDTSERRR